MKNLIPRFFGLSVLVLSVMTLCGYVVCRFVFVREWDFIGFVLSPIVLISLFGFGVWMGMKESEL